jgi:hypothetical protein
VPFTDGFPSGIVEKSTSLSLRLDFFTSRLLEGYLRADYEHLSSFGFQEGAEYDRLYFSLLVSWYLTGSLQ